MDSKTRRQLWSALPWVTYLEKGRPCDGIKWSRVPLKAIYTMHGKPPTGLDPYRCKNVAHWRFVAARKGVGKYDRAKTGNYCMPHLYTQTWHNQVEHDRYIEHVQRQRENEPFPDQ